MTADGQERTLRNFAIPAIFNKKDLDSKHSLRAVRSHYAILFIIAAIVGIGADTLKSKTNWFCDPMDSSNIYSISNGRCFCTPNFNDDRDRHR